MKVFVYAVALMALSVTAVLAEGVADDADFEPVHPQKLIKVLPDGTKDFSAAKAKGAMSGELGSKITIVSRVYTYKGGDEFDDDEAKPTVTIKISDTTATKSFADLHNKLAEMGQSAKSGYSNALSIDGHLAIRNYREKDQVGVLSLYANDRFLVQIAIRGLPETAMMEWWGKVDQKTLAALAIPPTPTPLPTPSHTPVSAS